MLASSPSIPSADPLATVASPAATRATARPARRLVTLAELSPGETARVVRVNMADTACRRRFAELGLAEGMKVTVSGSGDTLMVMVAGAKMALASRCAREIQVMRM